MQSIGNENTITYRETGVFFDKSGSKNLLDLRKEMGAMLTDEQFVDSIFELAEAGLIFVHPDTNELCVVVEG